jgi:hypothetical protein
VIKRVATGSALTELQLDAVGLDATAAAALACAVRSHRRLQQLSIERNSLNETALVAIAAACAGHPSLCSLSVANQCNQELLTQSALLALVEAMESTPKLIHLRVGKVIDPQLTRRLDAAQMANRDLLRQQRVAEGSFKDTRRAATKVIHWEVEAQRVATSQPYEYGVPLEAVEEGAQQTTYTVAGSPLWRAATERERVAVIEAFHTNQKVTSLALPSALITDAIAAAQLGELLEFNQTLTSLNVESNLISSAGVEAIARGVAANSTLTELRMANQGIAMSQESELVLARAVMGNATLLHVTVDLRNGQARDMIHTALSRNRDQVRLQRQRSKTAAPMEPGAEDHSAVESAGAPGPATARTQSPKKTLSGRLFGSKKKMACE